MLGFRITCVATSFRDRELAVVKGWSVDVAETHSLVAKLRNNPAFKLTPCEVPDKPVVAIGEKPNSQPLPAPETATESEPSAERAPHEDDDISLVSNIPERLIPGLKAKGFDTVAKAVAAGIDGLSTVDGIASATANNILLACSEYLGE